MFLYKQEMQFFELGDSRNLINISIKPDLYHQRNFTMLISTPRNYITILSVENWKKARWYCKLVFKHKIAFILFRDF